MGRGEKNTEKRVERRRRRSGAVRRAFVFNMMII
jgi:hypothetical protein